MRVWLAIVIGLVSAAASAQDTPDPWSFANEGTVNAPIGDRWRMGR